MTCWISENKQPCQFLCVFQYQYCGNIAKTMAAASSGSGAVKAFLQGHHHHHHHDHDHHRPSPSASWIVLYICVTTKRFSTTKIHIFTKGFKHIRMWTIFKRSCRFSSITNQMVLDKLWHDIINSTRPNMPVLCLACHLRHNTPNLPCYNNEQTTKQTKAMKTHIYINISCKCDTNRPRNAGHRKGHFC